MNLPAITAGNTQLMHYIVPFHRMAFNFTSRCFTAPPLLVLIFCLQPEVVENLLLEHQ